jgi:citrate synthase
VADQTVQNALAAGQRLPGLGHRAHKVDPRTAVLFGMARQANLAGEGIAFVEALEAAIRRHGKTISINIDGALAAILHDLGFPPPFGKLLFIIGRVAGLSAEVAEEYERETPMRVKIPLTYDGPPPREIP